MEIAPFEHKKKKTWSLATNSVTRSTWLQRADFFASKSLNVMSKSSVTTSTQFLLHFCTRCSGDPV